MFSISKNWLSGFNCEPDFKMSANVVGETIKTVTNCLCLKIGNGLNQKYLFNTF